MSKLKTLIQESKISKKELIASTIRMPKELHTFIDELAEHLSLSKQEMMLTLIEEGVSIAEQQLNATVEEGNSNFHILNTNLRHGDEDHNYMINNGIAAAFYDPWTYNIDRINLGDTIFLYQNGVGIVAYGKGTGETKKKDHNGTKDACHYQVLTEYTRIDSPLPASEIKKILNRNVAFLRTMSSMPDGQKILDIISQQKASIS